MIFIAKLIINKYIYNYFNMNYNIYYITIKVRLHKFIITLFKLLYFSYTLYTTLLYIR